MKVTRYLWISSLPRRCKEEDIHKTFQSHGKIQTIRIHEVNRCRGAIVAFIDCKSSTQAHGSVKSWQNVLLNVDYCEADGEPGIASLGKAIPDNGVVLNMDDKSKFRSNSSSSNTSSFGSSLDDCSKYPSVQINKREDGDKSMENNLGKSSSKSPQSENTEKNAKDCLNVDYRGILVENLSQRSSDSSLREGLFHEFKKHGKITSVAVMGQGADRHAIISFKRVEDMEKAFEASNGKVFFGNPIKAKKHNGYKYVDPDLCPPEHAMDEYHPKATKTLFIGKLATGSVVELDLRKVFKRYGEIIDIDIKIQSNQPDTSFAFVQYYDISSVVRALRNQDAIKVDGKPVKLGFGKSQPANCLWVGNLQRNADDGFLRRHFRRFGLIAHVIPDLEYTCALIQYESSEDALWAFTDTRERSNNCNITRRMQVDYASNEYQVAFMDRLRKSSQTDSQDFMMNIADPYQTEKIQNLLISYSKCLGLLEETRSHSYDRYDSKSDYEENYELYQARPYRQRKSVHQRLYNESYGVDEGYVDEYHYSKPKGRHYDECSSSRSPVRYVRSNRKYEDEQYRTHDLERPPNYYYNREYHDNVVEPSSTSFYPYRRTPDPPYSRLKHNRSYSPSPTSSWDYCDDYARYNLPARRFSRTNKDYHTSRSRHLDLHFVHESSPLERTLDMRSWPRPPRRDFDEYSSFRSKSGSRTKIARGLSPHLRNGRLRNLKCELLKTSRIRGNDYSGQRCSASKTTPSTNYSNNRPVANDLKTKASNESSKITVTIPEIAKLTQETGNVTSVVQQVDVLSKLERERAKLLEELSQLSEDTSGGGGNMTSKVTTSVLDLTTNICRKKALSPKDSLKSSVCATIEGLATPKVSTPCFKTEPTVMEEKLKFEEALPGGRMPLFDVATLSSSVMINDDTRSSAAIATPDRSKAMSTICTGPEIPFLVESSSKVLTPDINVSSQSRDPRLNPISYHIRPLSSKSPLSINSTFPLIPLLSTEGSLVDPPPVNSSHKGSNSDSDIDHFSNIDIEVDKRIRELDAKMIRNGQTVRTLDYSKFRIRKKAGDGVTGSSTTFVTPISSSLLSLSSSISMTTSTSLLGVGYWHLNRDTGSNTSDFIKTMLNQTKQKTYHPLSDSGSDVPSKTVDLGANDIERRSFFSRFVSTAPCDTSIADDSSTYRHSTSLANSRNSFCKSTASLDTDPSGSSYMVGVNQPMKSILKKSKSAVTSSMKPISKPCAISATLYNKTTHDAPSYAEYGNSQNNTLISSISHLKRKIKSEPEDVDFKQHFKKNRNENGPVLDDTLFQSYPSAPVKKMKRSLKKSLTGSSSVRNPILPKKSQSSSNPANNSLVAQKSVLDKNEKIVPSVQSKEKINKAFKENKKSNGTSDIKQSQMRNRKSKSNKEEKTKKLTNRKKEKVVHMDSNCKREVEKGDEDRLNNYHSDDYESMYDKIKRRNSKMNRMNGEMKRRHSGHSRFTAGLAAVVSDDSESDACEYWRAKSGKHCSYPTYKQPCLSDMSSIHFSDSNSCKTTPCGKEYSDSTCAKTLDEGKAPVESLTCTSPKYITNMTDKAPFEASITKEQLTVSSAQCKSLHRPNDGPLKKRPITEPIMLSEDLPYLEKQSDDEYIMSSPMSINDEPPGQLESMYDVPSAHPPNVLEEVDMDNQQDSIDAPIVEVTNCHSTDEVNESPLPADVNSASHILLTMKSQPAIENAVVSNDPDQQLQSVAEHLISLAQNSTQMASHTVCEKSVAQPVMVEGKTQVQVAVGVIRPPRVSTKQDDEVTIYVKKIIDRIKQETDIANTMNKDKLACKRAKKTNAFNIPLSKSMLINSLNHECRHILPIDIDSTSRITSTPQQLTLSTVTSSCVMITTGHMLDQIAQVTNSQLLKHTQPEEKHSIKSDTASLTDKRLRHNSAKSDGQLQSLEETIDHVVKGSLSSSEADAVSNRSVTDIDESKSLSNSFDSVNVTKTDLTSLEETMNEVINKMNANSPSGSSSSLNQFQNDPESLRSNNNVAKRHTTSHDNSKHKRAALNRVKSSIYQFNGNVGGITNLVLGIPSIMTLASQQNSLNHVVSFQNAVSCQSQQARLTAPPTQNSTATSSSEVSQSLLLTPTNMQQHCHNGSMAVQSTEMVFSKLNSLTPIMIQGPSRPPVNPVSLAAGGPRGTETSDTDSTPSNIAITAPVSMVPMSSTSHGFNLAKISTTSIDANLYLMMQRQMNQANQNISSMSPLTLPDVNVSGLAGRHSIILSQIAHTNSVLSPITPGVLTSSINRSTSGSIPLQVLSTTNGITNTCPNATPSILYRPNSIAASKFEEKDDWLKQNRELDLNYPVRWTGKLCLKNDEVFVQMHLLAGNEDLIRSSMNLISVGQILSQPLRIVQRMRLEPNQLESLQKRLCRQLEFCTCLTLAGGDKADELSRTSATLHSNFINYLQEKSAAGIINICTPDSQQNVYVIHIFPPCEFSDNQLKTCSLKLYENLKEKSVPYLIIVITTV